MTRQLDRKSFLKLAGVGALGLNLAGWGCSVTGRRRPPNFIFILVDDLGWADVGAFGSSLYETPNINRLIAQGMRFNQAYAACPVCSPTRAAVLTGKYPARLNLTDWIPGHFQSWHPLLPPQFNQELPLQEKTITEVLKEKGYRSASVGKWHLGREAFYPEQQGFDINIAGTHRGQPPSYYYPYKNPRWTIPTLPDNGNEGEYLTDRLTAEALGFIRDNQAEPFFLYLPYFAVHTPIQGRSDLVRKYEAKDKPAEGQNNPGYAAMVTAVDEGVGRIMAALDRLNLAKDTVIFFTSDNGGLTRVTSNAPLRNGKGSMYEGGIRVPLAVRWPGVVAGGSSSEVPVSSQDYLPTIAELAGIRIPEDHILDGVSLAGVLRQDSTPDRDALFWHYPHYHPGGPVTPCGAIRAGDYKLIEFYEDGRLELYNLHNDLGETRNLVDQEPERTNELLKRLQDWRKSVDAKMPVPNPDYDPAKDKWKQT